MRGANTGVLGQAIIWAAVMIACALALSGTECFDRILPLLGGGAAGSVVIAGAGRKPGAKG